MEDHRDLLRDAFGESSDSEDDDDLQKRKIPSQDPNNGAHESIFEKNPSWERISEIKGLSLCRDFLSPHRQSSLLAAIHNEGWFTAPSHNQAMRFGDLPKWAIELVNLIREVVHFSEDASEYVDIMAYDEDKEVSIFPSNLLWREPLFDQLIVNVYQPGEGICSHVDLLRFDDGIAILSLESSCVMHFSRAESEDISCNVNESETSTKIPVYLSPGSLVLMWGEARYLWKHEINRKPGFQKWEGTDIDQEQRTSITLRKLCHNENE